MPVGQSLRKPLYHCFSSCSLNSVLLTRSSSISGASLLLCLPMAAPGEENPHWWSSQPSSSSLADPTSFLSSLDVIQLADGCPCRAAVVALGMWLEMLELALGQPPRQPAAPPHLLGSFWAAGKHSKSS